MSDEQDEWTDVFQNGSLLKKILRKSERHEDERVGMGKRATIHYVVKVDGTDQVVEDTRESNKPVRIITGQSDVLTGIDMAIALMVVGEVSLLKIEPKFGYGTFGLKPHVNSDTKLLCEVEVLDAEDLPDYDDMDLRERLTLAVAKKDRGNWYYGRNDVEMALNLYAKGLKFLETFPARDDDIHAEANSIRVKIYSNMAQCQIKLNLDEQAMESCKKCLTIEPTNVKALFRSAIVLAKQNCYAEALIKLRVLLEQEPGNSDAIKLKVEVKKRKQEQDEEERKLYGKMLQGANYADMMSEYETREPSKFGTWLSSISPFIGKHYLSPDFWGGIVLILSAILLFISLIWT